MLWQVITYLLTGGLGGFLSGLLGVGGGIIFVFVIGTTISLSPNYEHLDKTYAYSVILNSVFCILFTSLSGCIKLYRQKEFDFKAVTFAAIPAALSAAIATILLSQINYSKQTFLILFSLALIPILLKFLPKKKTIHSPKTPEGNLKFSLSGLFTGLGSALTGLGGGFLFSPILHGYYGYPVKKTFAISLGVIFITSGSILLTYSLLNSFQPIANHSFLILPEITIPLVIGAIIMAPFGILSAQRMKDDYLRILFLLFAVVILAKNLFEIFS